MSVLAELLRRLINNIVYPIKSVIVSPRVVFSVPRKFMGLSLPARWAIFMAMVLILSAVASYFAIRMSTKPTILERWKDNLPIIAVLTVVIPIVVYAGLRFWLEGEISRFPDIENAWRAGIEEMRRQGLEITDIPLFVVLGSPNELVTSHLFDATRLGFNVRDVPKGPAPLHWFASQEGVFVVLDGTCRLSRLAQLGLVADERDAQQIAPVMARQAAKAGNIRGTIVVGEEPEPAPETAVSTAGAGHAIRGTLNFGGTTDGQSWRSASESAENAANRNVHVALPAAEAIETSKRLSYVCELIRRSRQPLCPVNGILTLLSFELIEKSPFEATQVQKAAKEDLAILRHELKIRCPVTALITGMQSEPGFREMVRRVGEKAAVARRFGKGHRVWVTPSAEQLEALSQHACGAFELWTYNLFRERGALAKPGNTKLYQLLCRIRRSVRQRLTNILSDGFSAGDPGRLDEDSLLFSGCYFAAVGPTEDRQAFVRNVFEKLPEEQEELEWSAEAIRINRRYHRWAQLVIVLDVILALGLVAGLMLWYFRSSG